MDRHTDFPRRTPLGRFVDDDSGAVTVDFVVITGGVIGLGLAVVGEVRSGAVDLAGGINASLGGASVASIQQALANVHAGGGGGSGSSEAGGASEGSAGQGGSGAGVGPSAGLGNPGNDKPVGKAGENPSGKDFGDGIRGNSQ